jgi:hypothetical protein
MVEIKKGSAAGLLLQQSPSSMEAVQNGFHVHLGVSQNEKRPNALFLAELEKEKPFLPVASAP